MAPLKELHAFPPIAEQNELKAVTRGRLAHLSDLCASMAQSGTAPSAQASQEFAQAVEAVSVMLGLPYYLPHFGRLAQDRPDARLFGEITPAYTSLSAKTFGALRAALIAEGYAVRIVLLMRDPVQRCLSAMRMGLRDSNPSAERLERVERNFVTLATADWQQERTRYDLTIQTLETCFAPTELFYGFYETLFEQAEIDRLCDFLGIPSVPAMFDERANASPKFFTPGPDAMADVARQYQVVYDFCEARFGASFIRGIWHNAPGKGDNGHSQTNSSAR